MWYHKGGESPKPRMAINVGVMQHHDTTEDGSCDMTVSSQEPE